MACTGDPEVAATTVGLLLAHLTWNKRLLGAMVLDRLDAESLSTRAEFPDRYQRLVNWLDSVNGLNPWIPCLGIVGGLPAPTSHLGDKADFTPSPLKGQAATGAA